MARNLQLGHPNLFNYKKYHNNNNNLNFNNNSDKNKIYYPCNYRNRHRNHHYRNYYCHHQLPAITSILFILLCTFSKGLMGECPRLCECKWKSGKESVLCLNANLSQIPVRLDAGTQVLDLTGNDIITIPHDTFANANLVNLQKIFLSKCRLKIIERFAFRKLNNLVELDLSYNLLIMIPSPAFDSIPELREIKLNGNPIQRISNEAFVRVPQLIRLELSDCKISVIEPRAFLGLENSLEWLKLDGNKLVEIRPITLTSLRNLHGLELARNLWNCSCHLRPLRAWMLRENVPYDIPPICRTPQRLNGKSWDKIGIDDFACAPQIIAYDTKAHVIEGKNVTMTCLFEGIPEPHVRWSVKNRIIANLSGDSIFPAVQGRKLYVVNMQKNTSNLTILSADIQDAGIYICTAENKAGRVEASIMLTISRKPPEAPLGLKVILICILIAIFFVVGSSFAVICFCTLKKRKKKGRWNAPARIDSYEKIEMSRKSGMRPFRAEENGYIRPHPENGIAIVNPTKKNGDYRNVPTDDDGTGYEDNNDTSGCSGFGIGRRENTQKWKDACLKSASDNHPLKCEETDLHIPRLIDISSNPDSGSSSVSSQVDAAARLNGTTVSTFIQPIQSWSNQILNRRGSASTTTVSKINLSNQSTNFTVNSDNQTSIHSKINSPRIIENDFCETDRKYPDLLDASIFGSTCVTTNSVSTSSALCTLPRKFRDNSTRYFKSTSDSQSPLLSETSNKYGSGTLGETNFYGSLTTSRRASSESYSNYPLSTYLSTSLRTAIGSNSHSYRSSSYLNLLTTGSKIHRRNPSLPSSPILESQRALSSAATPLLDFSSLTTRSAIIPSTSTVNAYDYHAAQLERFLEEYRNLQEQLCKMKETCESIRKKEAPLCEALGHSAQFADPVMFNAAIASSNLVVDHPPNPKTSILKNKSILPGQPPDPPPYWLHRNAMLKRFNDSQSTQDFFKS